MAAKSVLDDARQVGRAIGLIQLGARLQVLECETDLSYDRLLRLYKEVAGKSPAKGQLPFSPDWFLSAQPNVHASLFLNTYHYLAKASALEPIDAIMKAFKLYGEQAALCGLEPLLSVTRAWKLVEFIDSGKLVTTRCTCCSGHFVTDRYENPATFECGLCTSPARTGRGVGKGVSKINQLLNT
jgi:flagellar transcriptional activator FlhC